MPQFIKKVGNLESYILAFSLFFFNNIKVFQWGEVRGRYWMKRSRWAPKGSPVSVWESLSTAHAEDLSLIHISEPTRQAS